MKAKPAFRTAYRLAPDMGRCKCGLYTHLERGLCRKCNVAKGRKVHRPWGAFVVRVK